MRIIFAGTPNFAIPCLSALANSKHQILAVYTQPDRPAGRGLKLKFSAVKNWATTQKLPVFQPENFKDPQLLTQLTQLKPDLIVVIAYGLILPQSVLNLPSLGCINVHASILPRFRGASPIQQAILHGDKYTGVTIMQMNRGMDTGDVLRQLSTEIQPHETAGSLHDRLALLSVEPLLSTLNALTEKTVTTTPQDHSQATYAEKITKVMAKINWNKSAVEIDRMVRAFNPWPIAYTNIVNTETNSNSLLRIHQASIIELPTSKPPGSILSIDKEGIYVATGKQILRIEILQSPGGKALPVASFHKKMQSLL